MTEKISNINELDSRVAALRSQSLSFGRDGMQFSLNVPDSDDVKSAFGHMAHVIVKHQNELTNVHANIKRVAEDVTKSQFDIMGWAKKCIEELREQNAALEAKLEDCQAQIRNFSYNVQGFVFDDVDKENKYKFQYKQKEMPLVLDGGNQATSIPLDDHLIKVTSEYDSSSDNDSIGIKTPASVDPLVIPTVDGGDLNEINELENKQNVIFNENIAKEKDQDKLGSNKSNRVEKKSSSLPHSRKASMPMFRMGAVGAGIQEALDNSRHLARTRWNWAIRKVRVVIRLKSQKQCMTRSRIPKGFSMIERLERLEHQIYEIPIKVQQHVEEHSDKLYWKLLSELAQREQELSEYKQGIDMMFVNHNDDISKIFESIDSVDHKVNEVGKEVENVAELARQPPAPSIDSKLEEKLLTIINRLEGGVKTKTSGLKSYVAELDMKMDAIEVATRNTEKKIHHLTNPEVLAELDNSESLSKVLKNDTDLREARGQMLVIDSTLTNLVTAVKNCKRQFEDLEGSPEADELEEEEFNEILDLAPTCDVFLDRLKALEARLQSSYEHCRKFDRVVGKRWIGLSQGGQDSNKLIEIFNSAIMKVENKMLDRPTIEEVQAMVQDNVSTANDLLEAKIQQMIFKLKMRNIEQDVSTDTAIGVDTVPVTVPVPGTASSSKAGNNDKPSSATEPELDIPKRSYSELEAYLEPFIRDIVEMYVGGSQNDENFGQIFRDGFLDMDGTTAADECSGDEDDFDGDSAPPSRRDKNDEDQGGGEGTGRREKSGSDTGRRDKSGADTGRRDTRERGSDTGRSEGGDAMGTGRRGRKDSSMMAATRNDGSSVEGQIASTSSGRIPGRRGSSYRTIPGSHLLRGESINSEEEEEIDGAPVTSRKNPRLSFIASAQKSEKKIRSNYLNSRQKQRNMESSDSVNLDDNSPPTATTTKDGNDKKSTSSKPSGEDSGLGLQSTKEPLRPRATGKPPIIRRDQNSEGLKKIRDEVMHISDRFDKLLKDKADVHHVENLISSKADNFDLDRKADVRVLETIERSLRNVMQELGDIRSLHEDDITRVKDAMEKNLKRSLKILFAAHEDSTKPSFLATKSLCLSCGRASLVKSVPDVTQTPPFLPQIHSAPTPGPDVYRAGFKMPYHPRDNLFSGPASNQIKISEIDLSSPLPMDDNLSAGTTPVQSADVISVDPSIRLQPIKKDEKPLSIMKTVIHAGGRDEALRTKPLHKRGLKGNKSERAVNMFGGPDKFDLEGHSTSVQTTLPAFVQMSSSQSTTSLPESFGQRPKFLSSTAH